MLSSIHLKRILNQTLIRNTIKVSNYGTFRNSLANNHRFGKFSANRQNSEVIIDGFNKSTVENNEVFFGRERPLDPLNNTIDVSILPEIKKSIIPLPTENSQLLLDFMKEHEVSLKSNGGSALADPILNLDDAPFSTSTKDLLKEKFDSPTPIQSLGWPVALSGKDMLAVSKTGSGKTISFILPAIQHILSQNRQPTYYGPSVLVVAPTRELASQITQESYDFLKKNRVNYALVYGGESRRLQENQFKNQPKILIGTPGRILDFVESGTVSLKNVSFLVVDEADRLLEMGFEADMNRVFSSVRPDRQVLYWSATWPKKVQQLANKYIKNPVHLQVGSSELSANKNITQNFLIVDKESEKVEKLLATLDDIYEKNPKAQVLIFTMTKKGAETLTDFMGRNSEVKIDCLHGDKTQSARNQVVNRFKNNKLDILVATDVASRGLDIRSITDVINFSLPPNCETYVHRIGRTARAGATGTSHSILSKESINDTELIGDLVNLLERSGQHIPDEFYQFMQSSNNHNGGGGGGYRNNGRRSNGGGGYRNNGYGNRNNGYGNRNNGYGNRNNGYGNRDNGYGNRNNGNSGYRDNGNNGFGNSIF